MKGENLKKKKVLILGFGREGRDVFSFLRKRFPGGKIGIADRASLRELPPVARRLLEKSKGVTVHLGGAYLKSLKGYNIIIKSPGVPPKAIAPFVAKGQRITSETGLFFESCPGTIIGVTGTKGKSTTASLIYQVLKAGGIRAHLIGNIGRPALSFLDKATSDDIFVYELSSFQLDGLTVSPHIAVFLNIYPEHLDHHRSFTEYKRAKANIVIHQSKNDYLIFNAADKEVEKIADRSSAKKITFKPTVARRYNRTLFLASPEPARIIGRLFGISNKRVAQAIEQFNPLPHRLEYVGTHKEVLFYNDSLATIPEATMRAMDVFGRKLGTLIVGGFDRGISFERLAKRIAKSRLCAVVLLPVTGRKIEEIMRQQTREGRIQKAPRIIPAANMEEAVQFCYERTPKGKICLLSPAAPSFGMFRDYADRGETFKRAVKGYGKT